MLAEIEIKGRSPDCIRVVQITDTHIFASAEGKFDGLDTSASLAVVIEHIRQKELPDLVLVTGDLVHDPVVSAYDKLRGQLHNLDVPTFCIPGNHDDPVLMHRLLNQDKIHTDKFIETGDWIIVMLDTYLPDSHSGRLANGELNFLEQNLERYPEKYALVCLHHPPVLIDSIWMDTMMLENPEDLFAVIDKYKKVQALIWGHIHQEFRTERRGVILCGSPSTCVQFKPCSENYATDDLGPGYSVLQLYRNGTFDINTQRPEENFSHY